MSNIVNLADHLEASADSDAENRARRAETVRAKAEEGCTLTPADQERIAENLYRLLDRLEKNKLIRRAELCRDVLHSPPEESTKRLDFYALDPEKEGDKRQRQLSRLAKKATNYVNLAEAAARKANENVDAVLLDLVHGTALARSGSLPPEDPMTTDLKGKLIRNLERAASSVASDTGLQRAFQMIARYPAKDNYLGDDVVAGPINETPQYLEDGSSTPQLGADRANWWRLVESAPSLLLGEAILDQREIEPQLRRSALQVQWEDDPENPFGRVKFRDDDVEPRQGEQWHANTEYRVQVWLALLPFGRSHEPRLGLWFRPLRRVHIERTSAHERQGSDDRLVRETLLSKRIYDLQECAKWQSHTEDLRVTVPIDLAPFLPWPELLGRELYRGENQPGRVLAFGSDEAQQVLNLPDCETISDWVGPIPDRRYSFRLGPKPDDSDWERLQDWECARQEANDQDRDFRFRFADRNGDGPQEEQYPMSWKAGTLGYKLERSLLEVDGNKCVIQQLRLKAGELVATVTNRIDAALSAREERLVSLHHQRSRDSS